MQQITRAGAAGEALIVRVGADLAKRMIQVHAVDAQGHAVYRRAPQGAVICEAASRPAMRFVPVKSVEQQSMLRASARAGRRRPWRWPTRTRASCGQ